MAIAITLSLKLYNYNALAIYPQCWATHIISGCCQALLEKRVLRQDKRPSCMLDNPILYAMYIARYVNQHILCQWGRVITYRHICVCTARLLFLEMRV